MCRLIIEYIYFTSLYDLVSYESAIPEAILVRCLIVEYSRVVLCCDSL
jgi:hypothetical protein